MTFSIVARCAETGMFGGAISSLSPADAARCAYARAGLGAVSSQNVTDRLIAAMRAGLAAGGEAGPVHSAGMMIVDKVSWPLADLRCDWTEDCPMIAISDLWDLYKPQMDAYIQRALDPREAQSYGVPDDE